MSTEMQLRTMAADPSRVDLKIIAGFVTPGTRVLDVGCGDGALLMQLAEEKNVDARGIEISQKGVNEAVASGLSVIQGDADRDLATYRDKSFDFAILSQTIQATHNPRIVLEELLRIGEKAIVSFPNFGHWRIRMQFLLGGRMPVNKNLPYSWYDTPNIHFFTIRDFIELVDEIGATIEDSIALHGKGHKIPPTVSKWFRNLFGEQVVFVLSRPNSPNSPDFPNS